MQAVGADHEVELAVVAAAERDAHPVAVVVDRRDRVAEDGLDASFQRTVDGCGEVGAGDGHVPVVGTDERRGRERGDPPAVATDGAHLPEVVAVAPELGDDAHPLRHVEARAPEVHGVAAAAGRRGLLDQRRPLSEAVQPVGQRGARDARPVDQYSHVTLHIQQVLDLRFDHQSTGLPGAWPTPICRRRVTPRGGRGAVTAGW